MLWIRNRVDGTAWPRRRGGAAARPWRALLAALALVLAGCTVTLVPSYDPSLVEGISAANEEALALLSAVADGSTSAEFPEHAATYDGVIGALRALGMQAAARPVSPLSERFTARLAEVGVLDQVCAEPAACINTSPQQLATAADNLARMRTTHRTTGLEPDVVALFRNAHEISLDQALQVELALKRE